MKSQRKSMPSVTIGIPAHNEESGIVTMIESVMGQLRHGFKLSKIIVYCDGCTDNTVNLLKEQKKKYPLLTVVDEAQRKGKSSVLNALFSLVKTDILVLLDADIKLAHLLTLERLIKPFANEDVGIVSGNDIPFPYTNIFPKITNTFYEIWYETRKDLNGGDSIHNVHGPIYALSKSIYKTTKIPRWVSVDDNFMYLSTKMRGKKHVFAKNAIIYYSIPTNLHEYLLQSTRYLGGRDEIIRQFGDKGDKAFYVPRSAKIRGIITILRKKPIYLALALLLQVAVRLLRPFYKETGEAGTWHMVTSSKQPQITSSMLAKS